MTTIDAIIIHCSATKAGQDLRAKDIDRMHRARGFNQIGYNFVIDLNGIVENGRPLSIGGLDANGKPARHCHPSRVRCHDDRVAL